MDGGCTCAEVRFRLTDRPMVVHACHCTWCQRESGSAFALNAMIETDKLVLVMGKPEETLLPSASGKGQAVLRCPTCRIALWSHYAGAARKVAFVRVGCLDDPASCPPDVHIFTSSKLPWIALPEGIPSRPEYYRREEIWRPDAIARREVLLAQH
jgi:hypothetical protein